MSDKIGEVVNGYGQLKARQVTLFTWRVLSWRNDSITAYEVDLRDLACTCEDQAMNKQGSEVCDHLAVALYAAPQRMDVGEAISHDMHETMQELEGHVRAIERRATAVATQQQAGGAAGGSGGSESDSSGEVDDPVAAMEAKLDEYGLDPDDFELWIDDQFGSLQLDQDGYLDDDDFETLQDFKDDVGMQWDPDGEVNYLKSDDFGEVLG